MADDEELPGPVAVAPPERPFAADRPKNGRAKCKRCKLACEAGRLRLGRYVWNNFSASGGWTKSWFHPACLWEAFSKQRKTTKRVDDPAADIEGWEDLVQEDMDEVAALMRAAGQDVVSPKATKTLEDLENTPKQKRKKKDAPTPSPAPTEATKTLEDSENTPKQKRRKREAPTPSPAPPPEPSKDDYFRAFRRLCVELNNESSYLAKTALVAKVFKEGSDGGGFKGDLVTWVRLLLPMVEKRIYNLQSKQLVKLFSKIFQTNEEEMLEDLTEGDVAETIRIFFERSTSLTAAAKSNILIKEVDDFLEQLSHMTKEEEQSYHFKQIAKKCTPNDLKMIIRLVKHDLRINAGPKHILGAVHPDAYAAFQTSRDLRAVVLKATTQSGAAGAPSASSSGTGSSSSAPSGGRAATGAGALRISIKIMTPVLPMLAEACKSVEQAMKKCPDGMFSEIKYDGERVQVHKQGDTFKYFSRALKPVLAHKVGHFKDFIPDAFPSGEDLVLDAEILLIDTKTGQPLPFGSLGVHKQTAFKDANVCLFVFDCMYYNGESLMHKPMKERRRILQKVMVEIPNRILFSEQKEVHEPGELLAMMEKVFRLGLEGLVLKNLEGPYEPGKRHWLKVKKDYLFGGAIADTADLVVLGAFYGTGQKGGMMSIFLMGCFDPNTKRWCTVTKVHGGHDDETLARLQNELKMVKINKDPKKIPPWLKANKQMFPDFVAVDPEDSQVWEITGAEFTKTEVHTAHGISVRFPRVTRIRDDKTWREATNLPELLELYNKSKETASLSLAELARVSGTSSPSKSSASSPAKSTTSSPSKVSPPKRSRAADSDAAAPRKMAKRGPKKPLPDVFIGVRIRPPDGLSASEERDLVRYFVGYGGTVLDPDSKDKPSHVLHCDRSRAPASGSTDDDGAVKVDVKWVWDSVKQQRLLDTAGYAC